MTEPARTRPRRPVHGSANSNNATTFPAPDLGQLLYAYGASEPHLPTTLSTLDEILTDFIIETCHLAAMSASYSRRQKLKVEDFKFVLRHDERLLGRAMETLWKNQKIKDDRRMEGLDGAGGGGELAGLEAAAFEGGVGAGEMRGKKKGKKGKRKRREKEEEDGEKDDEGDDRGGKRVAS